MGTDWYRMLPRPGVSRARLAELIQLQAAAYVSHPIDYDFEHLPGVPGTDANLGQEDWLEPYLAAFHELLALVRLADAPDCYWRIAAIGLNQILPAEWRLAAYRSFLPEELPGRLRQWESYISEVRRGGHRDYLYAWYCYATTRQLEGEWQLLRERATAARDRGNAWAVKPALVEVREQILAMPLPVRSPPPYWDAGRVVAVSPREDGARRLAVAREWNRRVPSGQKVRVSQVPDFGRQLEEDLSNPWFTECLDWLRVSADDGYGLLLDA